MGDSPNNKQKKETDANKQEDEEELNGVINTINQYFGIGDTIADDADWLTMTYHDRDAGKVLNRFIFY